MPTYIVQASSFDSSRWTIHGRGTITAPNCIAAAKHLGEKLGLHGPVDFGWSRDDGLQGTINAFVGVFEFRLDIDQHHLAERSRGPDVPSDRRDDWLDTAIAALTEARRQPPAL